MNYTVDVIIPTYRPGKSFQQLLDQLDRQSYQIRRILVINTDESLYPAGIRQPECMELYHIRKEEFDHGTTRNRAAAMSEADLMLFMTQDAVPADTELVANLAAAFADETVGAAYARQIAHPEHSAIERYTRSFNYPEKSFVKRAVDLGRLGIKTFFCSDACAMYRRSLYLERGGFRPQAIFNEDMIFASELIYGGYGIAYRADAKVIHSHEYTGMQQLRRNFDNGVSHAVNSRLFDEVPAYGEGMSLVRKTAWYLITHGEAAQCPKLVWLSACKLIGFTLGKNYYKLPKSVIKKLTSNQDYWE